MAPTGRNPEENQEIAFEEAMKGFQYRQYVKNVHKNVHQVSEDMKEMYKIRAREPNVSVYTFLTPGRIKLSLKRSGVFLAHVEGTVCHVASSQTIRYQKQYRSDGEGYEHSLDVNANDCLSIGMELHHFSSEAVPLGTSEIDVTLKYE